MSERIECICGRICNSPNELSRHKEVMVGDTAHDRLMNFEQKLAAAERERDFFKCELEKLIRLKIR